MEILRRSPMLGILVALISAMALYDKFQIFAFILGVPLIFSGIMFCSYYENFPSQWNLFFVAFIFTVLCSIRIYCEITKPAAENFSFTNENGMITNVRPWGRMYASTIETERYGKFIIRTKFAEMVEGTRINFDGTTQKFRPKSKNSDFSEERYWKGRGVQSWIKLSNVKELENKFTLSRLRYKISRYLTIYTPKLISEYLKAAWIGEHTEELDNKHRKWGTSHLLAVSGFHVGIVILCAGFIFGNNVTLMSLILWIYIILTGGAASAMRAGLMLQVGIFAKILGRRINGVNSVSAAAVILLLYRPFLFWDIGFRLSVLAALTITSTEVKNFMWLLMSSIIFFVTFPQVSYTFKAVPAVGIFLNIFAPFYFSFAFVIASVVVLLNLIHFPFSDLLFYPAEGIFLLWEKFADFISEIISAVIHWDYFTAWIGTGILVFMICKYLNFSYFRTIVLMITINFMAFVIFL